METISRAADTVKTTLFGDSTGTGIGSTTQSTEVHRSMIDDNVTETKYSGRTETDPDAKGSYQPGQAHDSDKRPGGPAATGGHPQGANLTNEQGTNNNPFSSSNEPNTGFGGAGAQPSVTADPNSGQQATPKHQGADKPFDEPTGSGDSDLSNKSGASGAPSGGPGGMKLPDSDNKSKGEGTGTLYEKSTGLQADGGDFDATRPGAAREAARLMDEKGIHRGTESAGEGAEPSKEKKWYGVDHSGFGGHGSHSNKRGSVSSTKSGSGSRRGSTVDENVEKPTAVSNDHKHDYDPDYSEKKGLGQKIKDKLTHSKE